MSEDRDNRGGSGGKNPPIPTTEKQPYEKPDFVYEKEIEALAGSCGKTAADAIGGDVDCQIQSNS